MRRAPFTRSGARSGAFSLGPDTGLDGRWTSDRCFGISVEREQPRHLERPRQLGLQGLYQNHAGAQYVVSPGFSREVMP